MLTGDKMETAINVGFGCKLLNKDMEIFLIDETSTQNLGQQIRNFAENSK